MSRNNNSFYIPSIPKENKPEEKKVSKEEKTNIFASPVSGSKTKNKTISDIYVTSSGRGKYDDFKTDRQRELKLREHSSYVFNTSELNEIAEKGSIQGERKISFDEKLYEKEDNNELDCYEETVYNEPLVEEEIDEFEDEIENDEVDEYDYYEEESYDDYGQHYQEEKNHHEDEQFSNEQISDVQIKDIEPVVTIPQEILNNNQEQPKKVVVKRVKYIAPPISLLKREEEKPQQNNVEIKRNSDIINETMKDFKIDGYVDGHIVGPTVTQYKISIGRGVKLQTLSTIQDNLMMNLSATSIRIEAPVKGKNYAGIEVPNLKRSYVLLGDMIDNKEFRNSTDELSFAVGLDIQGNKIYGDITQLPHALAAGTTGSGKSIFINSLIISLIYKYTPEDVRLILIDPKKSELATYEDLPHLAMPVVYDMTLVPQALDWAVQEMEKRNDLFRSVKTKDINGYNRRVKSYNGIKLPRIVIIIDELADLIGTSSVEVENYIQRIAQKARSAGIHLILATQRPSAAVIKGDIKNNITVRLAFKVASATDSITILNSGGAEKLLGKGDVLYQYNSSFNRLQCAYVSEEEIEDITRYVVDNNEVNYLITEDQFTKNAAFGEPMEKYDRELVEVARFCVRNEVGSSNKISRKFGMGFNRANEIVETLQHLGVLGENRPGKASEVLVTELELEEIIDKINKK